MSDALFERLPGEENLYLPTVYTRGPWSPEAQHGGPPSALLAMAVEAHDTPDAPRLGAESMEPMFVARLNVELMRPVPLTPLRVRVRTDRPGRKVQLVEAALFSGEVQVARATAVRIRRKPIEIPDSAMGTAPSPPPPASGVSSEPPWRHEGSPTGFHTDGVDHRFVVGGFDRPGPAVDWIRLRVPLLAGQPTPPISRVAAAADFGNGVSWVLPRQDGYQFINPDLTIYLHAYPAGEWVCLDAVTWPEPHGVGLAESLLRDEGGPIGRSLQSLLLDRVEGRG